MRTHLRLRALPYGGSASWLCHHELAEGFTGNSEAQWHHGKLQLTQAIGKMYESTMAGSINHVLEAVVAI